MSAKKNGKANGSTLPTVAIQQVEMFRTVYALCDLDPKTKRLKATHFAVCLQHGRSPTWGVFNVRSGLMSFLYESRYAVEYHHPKKAWRVKQGSMRLRGITDPWDHEQKEKHLRRQLGGRAAA